MQKDYIELNRDLWCVDDDEIIVGCTNHLLAGQPCPKYVKKTDTIFKFESVDAMRPDMAGRYASCLRYKSTDQEPTETPYELDSVY